MSNPNHIQILCDGVRSWNAWRNENPQLRPDISSAELQESSLKDVNFAGADLSRTNLQGADLTGATLFNADLQFANLEGARGLDRIDRSKGRNILLARYSPEILRLLHFDKDHNERVRSKDFSHYHCPGFDFRGANFSGFDLNKTVFTDCCFAGADLSRTKLIQANLRSCELQAANLTDADLREASLVYSNLRRACLRGCNMRRADIRIADFTDADLYSADLCDVVFQWRSIEPDLFLAQNYIFIRCSPALAEALSLRPGGPPQSRSQDLLSTFASDSVGTQFADKSDHDKRLRGKSLAGYDLSGLKINSLDLSAWDLSNTHCEATFFEKTNLSGCNLNGAWLVNATFHESTLEGATLIKANLQGACLRGTDLRRATLTEVTLEDAKLEGANLESVDLTGSRLLGAKAHDAILVRAKLLRCDLSSCDLTRADLTEAILDDAVLTTSVFVEAKLVRATLRRAKMAFADFSRANLKEANVQGADFRDSAGLTGTAILDTCNYRLAIYDLKVLGDLKFPEPHRHNERILKNDFSNLNLSACDLRGADFTHSNLENAILSRTVLDNASLTHAKLSGTVLVGASMKNVDFTFADLTSANLERANLDGSRGEHATLVNAILRKTSLRGVCLQHATITGSELRDAVLENADLEEVVGLHPDQLAATDITAAKLPRNIVEFTGLKNIEHITTSARGFVLAEVLLCGYAAVQVLSISDAELLANKRILSAPFLDIHAPVMFFCYGCPLILLAISIWAHFYFQHLWEELSVLPAFFQDSRPIYKKVYPWFLNTFVSAHFPILKKDRPLLTHVQIACSVAVTWWLVPATIFLLWAKYLTRHDTLGTALQLLFLSVAIVMAAFLQYLASVTLRGTKRRPIKFCKPNAVQAKISAILLVLILAISFFSWAAIDGCTVRAAAGGWLQQRFSLLFSKACVPAHLFGGEISTKSSGWRGNEEDLVTGINLTGRNLKRAFGPQVFLARSILQNAHLEGANFGQADFRWADLSYAHLEKAYLAGADFRGANLRSANFTGANLQGAKLNGAHIRGAIWEGVVGLTKEQLAASIVD